MTIKANFNSKKATKQIKNVIKNFEVSIESTVKDVLFNNMLRDAKKNAQFRVLRRKKGRGTGNLSSAIFAKIKIKKDIVEGSLNVDLKQVPYARIHEFGGEIKPKKAGGALTIPFPGIKGTARDFKNTFIAKGVIFQKIGLAKKGKKGKIKPLFSLVKKVKIPKRPYLKPAILKNLINLRVKLKKTLEDLQHKNL